MACNVYGTPVTDATLKGMTEYHDKEIEAVDRARVALEMKNAEGKDTAARTFVDKILTDGGTKMGVRCLIYNATGSPLKLVAAFQAMTISDSPYPTLIQNGQWASFVVRHVGKVSVVYEATQYPARQWVLSCHHDVNDQNTCYAEIRPKGTYSMVANSANDYSLPHGLNKKATTSSVIYKAEDAGDVIISTIGNTDISIYEAIMTKTAALE